MIRSMLVYGYGAMTSAMVEGWLRAGVPAATFTAYNPRPKATPDGVRLTTEHPQGPFDAVLLGFKPAMLREAAPRLAPLLGPETLVLSVLAGIDCATLARALPGASGWVRVMPNLAAALGKSPIALAARGLSDAQRDDATALADLLGGAEWFADEAQFDLVSALIGSGPAFVYRFIDALAAGATALGLEAEQARRLAVRMTDGAAALAAASHSSPGELARRVASPGGMTQKGLDQLDADDALTELVERCLRAARERSAEMGAEARKNG